MVRRAFLVTIFAGATGVWASIAKTQTETEAKASSVVLVKAARLLDVRSGHYIENMAILIEGDSVKEARKRRRSGGARAEDRESD